MIIIKLFDEKGSLGNASFLGVFVNILPAVVNNLPPTDRDLL